MKFKDYIKDKTICIFTYSINTIIIFLILKILKININIIIIIISILLFNGILLLIINYCRKKEYYTDMINMINKLDKKYLILETIPEPLTYEERIINNVLYAINKSMIENIRTKEKNITEFKEFIEIWVHEVKIPISSLVLKCHNNKEKYGNELINIVRKLDNYADNVLYYVRSENTEKDFCINEVNSKDIIRSVILKNKDDLLENNIDLIVDDINIKVYTDKKWIEYIINQIINNCIKYKKEKDSIIKISSISTNDYVCLIIYDNGIGIDYRDLKRVFDKSFTGANGRNKVKSTGMGLYIVKNLIDKLGHTINIDSNKNEYTEVKIKFGKNDLYKM